MTDADLLQFHELARFYDAFNERKDYRRESQRLESIARRYGPPGRTSWLDVACGTGRHLEWLRRSHRVVGVDGSREMLRVARHRLRGTRLVRDDMRRFRLRDRFDVATLLYGAIGHLQTEGEVRDALDNLARHLRPGGLAIIEPWVDRSKWRPRWVDLRTYQRPGLAMARLASSSRHGSHWIIEWQFLVAEPGRGVRHYRELDRGLLLSRRGILDLLRDAGFASRYIARGLTPERGLVIGVNGGAGPGLYPKNRGVSTRRRLR